MRILFVADGRSPITVNWLRYFVERGDEVFLASTFAGQPDLKLNGLEIIPVAFSGAKSVSTPTPKMPGQAEPGQAGAGRPRSGFGGASTLGLRTPLPHWLGAVRVGRAPRRPPGKIGT